jgi:CDP-6-deoxy-D-xylo-4-hexulose-3-dehydrase
MNELSQLIRSRLHKEKKFLPGKTKVQYSGPIFDDKEINAVIESLIGGWLAEGPKTIQFEKEFADFIGVKECILVNSGSSALLLAFRTLMHESIPGHLKEGDEIITSALTFPTTINSIILNGLKPVFVDVDRETYNINTKEIGTVITPKTKAILVTHHLGNPCEMEIIMEIANNNNLYVVEDCCDAHGAEYKGKKLGSFGDISCFSFYCAHAMTMGEGGAVLTKNERYRPILQSLKTCGRACVCPVCAVSLDPNFKCKLRWDSKLDGFENYDKRTLYTNIGYKMKILDLQAAFGIEQLKKLPTFIQKRQENFDYLVSKLSKYKKYLQLPLATKDSKASWFAVPITVREDAPFKRSQLTEWLEGRNIETRPLLGGNLLKQPAYKNISFKSTKLENTDFFTNNSFYVGCYPGITKEMLDYLVNSFISFIEQY